MYYLFLAILLVRAKLVMPQLLQCHRECSLSSNGQLQEFFHSFCCLSLNAGKSFRSTSNGQLKVIVCPSSVPESCPSSATEFSSCSDVMNRLSNAPSGDYNITLENGDTVTVYCDMEGLNCDGEGGWMRIANLNTSLTNETCPEGLTTILYEEVGYNVCDRDSPNLDACNSTYFSTNGINYTQVCGAVRGYLKGVPDAFAQYNTGARTPIDSAYADGVSITHGNPRRHIWTYTATGLQNILSNTTNAYCPCNLGSDSIAPPFVGDHYYCEIGDENIKDFVLVNDPLWDGQCNTPEEDPCCDNSQPWFVRSVDNTADDIELRLCHRVIPNNVRGENIVLDTIILYVR